MRSGCTEGLAGALSGAHGSFRLGCISPHRACGAEEQAGPNPPLTQGAGAGPSKPPALLMRGVTPLSCWERKSPQKPSNPAQQ